MKTGVGAGLLFVSPLGKHLRYVLRLHFPASNNVAEYEALVNGLRIAIELGVRRLDARGDSQLIIDQVMKNSHCRDPKMEAYCDEVRRLEDKFYGLELNHIARRYNETADELAKIASGRTTVPRTYSPETCINPPSRPRTRPSPRHLRLRPRHLRLSPRFPRLSPRYPRPSPRYPRHGPRYPRLSPRYPRSPRVRHCASRGNRARSRLIKVGRPRSCNISTEESCPSTKPKLGGWRGVPSLSSCWEMGRSSTTAAPQASSSDAFPSPKAKSSCKRYTRVLAAITQHLEPSLETPSDKDSTGRRWWSTLLELSAPAKGVSSTRGRSTCPLRLCRPYPSPGRLLCGV
jgi:ribonuclease HI